MTGNGNGSSIGSETRLNNKCVCLKLKVGPKLAHGQVHYEKLGSTNWVNKQKRRQHYLYNKQRIPCEQASERKKETLPVRGIEGSFLAAHLFRNALQKSCLLLDLSCVSFIWPPPLFIMRLLYNFYTTIYLYIGQQQKQVFCLQHTHTKLNFLRKLLVAAHKRTLTIIYPSICLSMDLSDDGSSGGGGGSTKRADITQSASQLQEHNKSIWFLCAIMHFYSFISNCRLPFKHTTLAQLLPLTVYLRNSL